MNKIFIFIFLVVVAAGSYFFYKQYHEENQSYFKDYKVQDITEPGDEIKTLKLSPKDPPPQERAIPKDRVIPTPKFRCDGRQYCSEMRSRDEAEFFLANCPGMKMDGDHDGTPCENDSRF